MPSCRVCEDPLWNARKKKNCYIDYKFGPIATKRRNLALKKRLEILYNGIVTQAHVAYPGRLMGKSKNEKNIDCL